jgi:hypothetical protein
MKKLTFKRFVHVLGRVHEDEVVCFINENDIKQEDILKLTFIPPGSYTLFYYVLVEE